jgi:hypothetical protein
MIPENWCGFIAATQITAAHRARNTFGKVVDKNQDAAIIPKLSGNSPFKIWLTKGMQFDDGVLPNQCRRSAEYT